MSDDPEDDLGEDEDAKLGHVEPEPECDENPNALRCEECGATGDNVRCRLNLPHPKPVLCEPCFQEVCPSDMVPTPLFFPKAKRRV